MLEKEPEVAEIITHGQISDEVDYIVAMFLANNRGFGLTACQPRLVRTKDQKELVLMSIDSTFRGDDNKIYGYGEVGRLYLDPNNNFEIVYCSPAEEIDKNRDELMETAEPQERPRGKY
ncbi:MAG: hypothetical protein ACTSVI_08830 [Promethearchaeota archaeon]